MESSLLTPLSAAERVVTLMTPLTALTPQSVPPGPDTTSTRSMSSTITSCASQNTPENSGVYTERPSIITSSLFGATEVLPFMPRALMAKLHSWFSVKSRRCCSFITECTVSRVCSGDMAFLVTGMILPLTFIDGGTPAVINKSEPPFSTIKRSSFSNSMDVLA